MTGSEHPTAAAESLAAVPFLAPLDPVDLAKLAGVLEDCWFDAGTVVFEAGGQGDALYILREGTAERRVAESRIGLIHPPEVFGELALLTDQPRSSSVVAVTPIRVWVLPKHRVQTLLRAEPELMFALSRAIGLELAHARRALGELLRELEQWVAGRLAALTPQQRDVVEAMALFETPSLRVLERYAEAHAPSVASRSELARLAPLLQERDGGYSMPAAIRDALLRHIDAEGRREAVEARVRSVGHDLERAGHAADALAAYRAAGADADVERLIAHTPALARVERTMREEPIRQSREALTVKPRRKRKFNAIKLTGMALALVPLLFWSTVPPEGLTPAGWRALLTLLSAAVLFASEALPEAVIALGLIAVWVVGGVVPPRDALDGFATQSWVLVLSVLAVGVAVGNSGLLYRVALAGTGPQTRELRAPLRNAGAGGNRGDTDASQCHEPRGIGGADGARSRGSVGLRRGWTCRDRIGARIVCRLRTDGWIVPHGFIGGPARAWVTAGLRARRVQLRRLVCRGASVALRAARGFAGGDLRRCIGRKTRRAASATGSRCNARC